MKKEAWQNNEVKETVDEKNAYKRIIAGYYCVIIAQRKKMQRMQSWRSRDDYNLFKVVQMQNNINRYKIVLEVGK